MDPNTKHPEATEDERVREDSAGDVSESYDRGAGTILSDWLDFYGAGFVDDFGA